MGAGPTRSSTLVETGSNRGYGGAANVGVAAADRGVGARRQPGHHASSAGAIDELLDVAGRWPRAGALGPRIHTDDGLLYPSARELPSIGRGVGHAVFGWVWPSNPWTAAYRRERGTPREGTAGWLSGACLMLRREAFASVGGFDERFFMYFEDTDLCERLAKAGWDVVYAPSATVVHHGGHATSRDLARMSKAHHDSAYRYLAGRYAGPKWAPVRGRAARRAVGAVPALAAGAAGPPRCPADAPRLTAADGLGRVALSRRGPSISQRPAGMSV